MKSKDYDYAPLLQTQAFKEKQGAKSLHENNFVFKLQEGGSMEKTREKKNNRFVQSLTFLSDLSKKRAAALRRPQEAGFILCVSVTAAVFMHMLPSDNS